MLKNTYGLVVCGGASSRMGCDKSMLTYYEKPQRYRLYKMLQPDCEAVLISCNETQASTMQGGYNKIADNPAYINIGPMAALFTAFTAYPEKNILLIGCDYPFLTDSDLRDFINYCSTKNDATAFCNKEDIYEPLIAWYPYHLFDSLKNCIDKKEYSLQHFLKDQNAIKYYPEHKKCMTSIDTHEQYIKALEDIKYEQPG